jgi:hypothetical protein
LVPFYFGKKQAWNGYITNAFNLKIPRRLCLGVSAPPETSPTNHSGGRNVRAGLASGIVGFKKFFIEIPLFNSEIGILLNIKGSLFNFQKK